MSRQRHLAQAVSRPADDTLRRVVGRLNDAPVKAQFGDTTVRILYWGANPDRCTDTATHAHSFFEACYVFRGRGTFQVDGTKLSLKAGSLFLSRPEQTHRIDTSTTDPMGIYFWAFTIDTVTRHGMAQPIDRLAHAFNSSLRNHATPKSNNIERTLELLSDEAARGEPGFETGITSLTQKLMLDTFRCMLDEPIAHRRSPAPERSVDAAATMAERFLRDNFNRAITLHDVARHVHMSPRHLSRIFVRDAGVTIARHLTALRIEAAGRMLLEGDVNIKQIASDCGYPDVAYFTTLFRKTTGFTPAVYREKRGQVYPLRTTAARLHNR